MVARTRLHVTLYVHCLACYVLQNLSHWATYAKSPTLNPTRHDLQPRFWFWIVWSFIIPVLQITVLNAGRKYLGTEDLAGKVFVSSGLGGMSGAQPKAAVIAGCIGVIAEVALNTCSFLFSLSLSYLLLGRNSSVRITTRYGLDSSGIEFQ